MSTKTSTSKAKGKTAGKGKPTVLKAATPPLRKASVLADLKTLLGDSGEALAKGAKAAGKKAKKVAGKVEKAAKKDLDKGAPKTTLSKTALAKKVHGPINKILRGKGSPAQKLQRAKTFANNATPAARITALAYLRHLQETGQLPSKTGLVATPTNAPPAKKTKKRKRAADKNLTPAQKRIEKARWSGPEKGKSPRQKKEFVLYESYQRKLHWFSSNSDMKGLYTDAFAPDVPFRKEQVIGFLLRTNPALDRWMDEVLMNALMDISKVPAKGVDLIFASSMMLFEQCERLASIVVDDSKLSETDFCLLAYLLAPESADHVLRDVGLSPQSYTVRLPLVHEALRRLSLWHLTRNLHRKSSWDAAIDLEKNGLVTVDDVRAFHAFRERQTPVFKKKASKTKADKSVDKILARKGRKGSIHWGNDGI